MFLHDDIVSSIHYKWFSNRSILHIDGTLTGTATLGQSGPVNNGNERCTPHYSELQNWNLITRYSLLSYWGHKNRDNLYHLIIKVTVLYEERCSTVNLICPLKLVCENTKSI